MGMAATRADSTVECNGSYTCCHMRVCPSGSAPAMVLCGLCRRSLSERLTGSIAFLWVWRQHIDVFSNGENAKPACQMVTVAYVFPAPLMNVPLHDNLFANIPT